MSMTSAQFAQLLAKFNGITDLKDFFEDFRVNLDDDIEDKKLEVDTRVDEALATMYGTQTINVGANDNLWEAILDSRSVGSTKIIIPAGNTFYLDESDGLTRGKTFDFAKIEFTRSGAGDSPKIKMKGRNGGGLTEKYFAVSGSLQSTFYDIDIEIEKASDSSVSLGMFSISRMAKVAFHHYGADIIIPADDFLIHPSLSASLIELALTYNHLKGGGTLVNSHYTSSYPVPTALMDASMTVDSDTFIFKYLPADLANLISRHKAATPHTQLARSYY